MAIHKLRAALIVALAALATLAALAAYATTATAYESPEHATITKPIVPGSIGWEPIVLTRGLTD